MFAALFGSCASNVRNWYVRNFFCGFLGGCLQIFFYQEACSLPNSKKLIHVIMVKRTGIIEINDISYIIMFILGMCVCTHAMTL